MFEDVCCNLSYDLCFKDAGVVFGSCAAEADGLCVSEANDWKCQVRSFFVHACRSLIQRSR